MGGTAEAQTFVLVKSARQSVTVTIPTIVYIVSESIFFLELTVQAYDFLTSVCTNDAKKCET